MVQKIIKFAVVGCGNIGSRHVDKIVLNKRAKLVAVCDVVRERADNFAKKYNCKAVYDFNELLKEDFDVVNICTPSGLHAEMSIKALKAGKNVLCEKPMTLNFEDAKSVVAAEKESGKKFFLVKQNRYNPPVKVLKDAVYNNKLGKICLVNCNVLWNRRESYYANNWKGTMSMDGGALMTQCSHFLDLMLWIGGKVKNVQARMFNLTHSYIETEDTGIIVLTFESGAVGTLQYTTTAYDKNMEGTMTVIGTEGNIKIGGEYINTLDCWNVKGVEKPVLEKGAEANDYGTYKGSMSNHDKVIENVISVLLDGEQIATNSIQGRDGVEVLQAAYISAMNKGLKISLPLIGKSAKFKLNRHPPLTGRKKCMQK